MTGYIIHYTDSSGNAETIDGISASSASTDITGLTDGETYNISVEATSEHLPGESEEMTIALSQGRSSSILFYYVPPPLTESPPATPEGLMLGTVNSTSITVSWEAVTDASSYTVTLTRATGTDQQGECTGSHIASVSVDVPVINASVDIGYDVESTATDMLRAYSTYFITVVAVSDAGGPSEDSDPISIFTPQTGINKCLIPIACLCMHVQVQQYLLAVLSPQLTAPLKYLLNGTQLGFHVELGMATSLVTEYSTQHSLMVWYRLPRLKV